MDAKAQQQAVIPHTPFRGTIARVAIQCTCPDSGQTGSFLFTGETPKNPGSRVTPVFGDVVELFGSVSQEWQQTGPGIGGVTFVKR